jgi:hypothetical protein
VVRSKPLARQLAVLAAVAAAVVGALAVQAKPALGQTEARLAAAESQAAQAQEQISSSAALATSQARRLTRISRQADRANAAAAASLQEVQAVEEALAEERTDALAEVQQLQSEYEDDKASHDDEVGVAIGGGLACLLLGAVALFWGWFRQLRPVWRFAVLTSWRPWAVAFGVTLAGLLVGATLADAGSIATSAAGYFIFIAPFGLSIAFLLARHSLRVEEDQEQSLITRRRFPRWVTAVLAALFLLVGVGSLAGGLTSEEPEEPLISAETRALAEAAEDDPLDPPTEELLAARAASEPFVARADELNGRRDEAEAALAQTRQALRRARGELRSAQLAAARLSRKLAREAARQARIQALATPAPSSGGSSSGSSGSYTNCDSAPSNIPVPPGSPLDGDGDGIGCED